MDTKEAARFLGVSYRTMEGWRSRGVGPKYATLGSIVVYYKEDLIDFARSVDPKTARERGAGE
jgi:predicted site-specific integrase-resolvase